MAKRRVSFQIKGRSPQQLEVPEGTDVTIGRARGGGAFDIREVTAPGESPARFEVRVHLHTISTDHARIRIDDEGATIEDLGSKNGTFVELLPHEPHFVAARAIVGPDLVVRVEPGRWALPQRLEAKTPEELVSYLQARLREVGGDVVLGERDTPPPSGNGALALPVDDGSRRIVVSFPAATVDLEARTWAEGCVKLWNLKACEAPGRPWRFTAASEARRAALAWARRAARSDRSILICGPTGAGKDVLARDIHEHGPRAAGPFVAVNCAAISPTLFERELFGHARGAFTGATHAGPGLVESAEGGTLFLDEVAEIPPEMQAKLLRFLDTRQIRRVGSPGERRVDARVIAATNQDLRAAQKSGRFREDLFYRLSGSTIDVPPLEPEDAAALARVFLLESASSREMDLAPEEVLAVTKLAAARVWRGAARELRNTIACYVEERDPGRRVEHNWKDALTFGRTEERAMEAPREAGTLPPGSPPDMDRLVFLLAAREARSARDLASFLAVSTQAVHLRLGKLGLTSGDIGGSEGATRLIEEARAGRGDVIAWLAERLHALAGGLR